MARLHIKSSVEESNLAQGDNGVCHIDNWYHITNVASRERPFIWPIAQVKVVSAMAV